MGGLGEEQPAFDEHADQRNKRGGGGYDRGCDAERSEQCEACRDKEGESDCNASQLHRVLSGNLITHFAEDVVLGEMRAIERARRAEGGKPGGRGKSDKRLLRIDVAPIGKFRAGRNEGCDKGCDGER